MIAIARQKYTQVEGSISNASGYLVLFASTTQPSNNFKCHTTNNNDIKIPSWCRQSGRFCGYLVVGGRKTKVYCCFFRFPTLKCFLKLKFSLMR